MECIFCKVVKNTIPRHLVYEDEYTLAFLDIAPVRPGHTIVIPKKHVEYMGDVDDVVLCHTIETVKKIGEAMKQALGAKGYNLMVNNGSEAGQLINHFHFHIIPRKNKEELEQWAHGKYENGEAEKISKQLKAGL
ncbi:MAG: HIT family protein [bacterium]